MLVKMGLTTWKDQILPSRESVTEIAVNFLNVLFPGYYEKQELPRENVTYYIWEKIAFIYHQLSRENLKSLRSVAGKQEDEKKLVDRSIEITFAILKKIPADSGTPAG